MTVLEQKPLKSTTKVEGILVKLENGQHYAITRYRPARSSWRLRAVEATRTGRTSDTVIFDKRITSDTTLDDGIPKLIYYIEHPSSDSQDPLIFHT